MLYNSHIFIFLFKLVIDYYKKGMIELVTSYRNGFYYFGFDFNEMNLPNPGILSKKPCFLHLVTHEVLYWLLFWCTKL